MQIRRETFVVINKSGAEYVGSPVFSYTLFGRGVARAFFTQTQTHSHRHAALPTGACQAAAPHAAA